MTRSDDQRIKESYRNAIALGFEVTIEERKHCYEHDYLVVVDRNGINRYTPKQAETLFCKNNNVEHLIEVTL